MFAVDAENPTSSTTCTECLLECSDPACCGFTSQCTEECVVIPCTDPHSPDPCSGVVCENQTCTDMTECTGIDDFMQCCDEYHEYFLQHAPSVDASSQPFAWDPTFEAMLHEDFSSPPQQYSQKAAPQYPAPPSESQAIWPGVDSQMDGSYEEAYQLTNPSFLSLNPTQQPVRSPAHSHVAAAHPCMWGDCGAVLPSVEALILHVNVQHLRLPPSPSDSLSPDQPQHSHSHLDHPQYLQQSLDHPNPDPSPRHPIQHLLPHHPPPGYSTRDQPQHSTGNHHNLWCLWKDCESYPDPSSIPGSSSSPTDADFTFLVNHLYNKHLGLPGHITPTFLPSSKRTDPPVQVQEQLFSQPHPSLHETDVASPPTPPADHDCCSISSHLCKWHRCSESFPSCEALMDHINASHVGSGKNHYDCYWDGCGRNGDKGFPSKQKICRHIQSHTGHRPYQCKICKQNFSEAATLQQHMRRHTQEKPYACDFPGCGKAFAITGALTIHKRVHNGIKPFKCTYCDKAFSESSNLSKHLRTHTGVRPYSCPEPGCGKSFARVDQLTRHVGIHKKKSRHLAETETSVPLVV